MSYLDLRTDEDREVNLINDIENKVRELRNSKSSRVKERWSMIGQYTKPRDSIKRKSVNAPLSDYTAKLRPNDSIQVGPSEYLNINPHFLVSIIKPLIIEHVNGYLMEFKTSIMHSIKADIVKHIEIGMAEFDYERQKELNQVRGCVVVYWFN